jgi:Ricin-type beta-trefoil lectin domain
MRKTFLVAAAVVTMTGAGLLIFDSSPTEAALLTVGAGLGPPYGGGTCADVRGNSLTPGTPVQAFKCLAGPNQQFELYGDLSGGTIYTLGGQMCLDVVGAGTAPGTPVDSNTCNGTPAQDWYYYYGQIIYFKADLCLDAGNMDNTTQLIVNTCNGSNSQQWQIK